MDHGIVFEHLEKRDKMQSIINTRRRYACLLAEARSCLHHNPCQDSDMRKERNNKVYFLFAEVKTISNSCTAATALMTSLDQEELSVSGRAHISKTAGPITSDGLMSCYLHWNE